MCIQFWIFSPNFIKWCERWYLIWRLSKLHFFHIRIAHLHVPAWTGSYSWLVKPGWLAWYMHYVSLIYGWLKKCVFISLATPKIWWFCTKYGNLCLCKTFFIFSWDIITKRNDMSTKCHLKGHSVYILLLCDFGMKYVWVCLILLWLIWCVFHMSVEMTSFCIQ